MCGILQRILDAARDRDCPIVHISALEGEQPFIASTPCLGGDPEPLIAITYDQYLGLVAEIWGVLAIEYDQELPTTIHFQRAAGRRIPSERASLMPRTIAGYLDGPLIPAAVQYTLDSYGQETTILYCGLRSFREIQTYWHERGEVSRAFCERYSCNQQDLAALLGRLDHTVHPASFDVEAFAAERGVTKSVRSCVCR